MIYLVVTAAGLSASQQLGLTLFASLTAPLIVAFAFLYFQRKTRKEEWERQDEKDAEAKAQRVDDLAHQEDVARKAKEVSDQAAAAAQLLVESNARVARLAEETKEELTSRLEQIHLLVNNNLTEQMLQVLAGARRQLATEEQLATLREEKGMKATTETLASIALLRAQIPKLEAELADRAVQVREGLKAREIPPE